MERQKDTNKCSKVLKIVLLGSRAGKTSLIKRFVLGEFVENVPETVGVGFDKKKLTIGIGSSVKLHLWDTTGQDIFWPISLPYVTNASAILIVYDITNRNSFLQTVKYIEGARSARGPEVPIVLVGNKADLPTESRQVTDEDGKTLAQEFGVSFKEVSAKSGLNVEDAFEMAVSARQSRCYSAAMSDDWCRIVLLGGSLSGRMSIANKFLYDSPHPYRNGTVGIRVFKTTRFLANGAPHQLLVFVPEKDELFKKLADQYIQRASAFIVVYDVSKRSTFQQAIKIVIEIQANQIGQSVPPILLIGNKTDLPVESRQVPTYEGFAEASKLGVLFKESSAENGYNLTKAFQMVVSSWKYIQQPKTIQSADFCAMKVLVLGTSFSGKTSLIRRFAHGDNLAEASLPTLGVELYIKRTFTLSTGSSVKLYLYDTNGHHRPWPFALHSIQNPSAVLIIYDVTQRATFLRTNNFLEAVRSTYGAETPVMIVGNKADVPSQSRQVAEEEGRRLASEFDVMFIETSALTGLNINEAFDRAVTAKVYRGLTDPIPPDCCKILLLSSTSSLGNHALEVRLENGTSVRCLMYDTRDGEPFRDATEKYPKSISGAILIYDVTQRSTYKRASKILNEIQAKYATSFRIMFVGNTAGLASSKKREVTEREGSTKAAKHSVLFLETSAQSGCYVIEAIQLLSHAM